MSFWQICSGAAPLFACSNTLYSYETQLLYGESFEEKPAPERFFQTLGGGEWAYGTAWPDGSTGWVQRSYLSPSGPPATHRLSVLRSFLYPEAELKTVPLQILSMGSRVSVVEHVSVRETSYARLASGGYVVSAHLQPLEDSVEDWVSVAELHLGIPYLWGGRTSLGLDCSALVQLCAAHAGHILPRDSGPQERSAGSLLAEGIPHQRGDLVFWKGHVGIMATPNLLLHASGHAMLVVKEPLAEVQKRIAAAGGGEITARRRLGFVGL